jgi:prophage regulatory protein
MNLSTMGLNSDPQHNNKIKKLIRIRSVVNLTGLSKSYVYQLVSSGHFPKSIKLVTGGTSVAWLESEIQEWINSRVQERNLGVKS